MSVSGKWELLGKCLCLSSVVGRGQYNRQCQVKLSLGVCRLVL